MNHFFGRIQALAVIIIASFLIIYPVYFQYNDLMEIDLSPGPSFENLDQENLLGGEQNKTKIFVIGFSFAIYLFGFFCVGQLPRLSYQIISLDHPIPNLRC